MVEFGRPFVAMRKDPRWVRKIAIGALINLIPYFGAAAVLGWGLEYLRRVAWGSDEELPEWTHPGKLALRGLWAIIAVLPYSLGIAVIATPIIIAAVFASMVPIFAASAGQAAPPAGPTMASFLVIVAGGALPMIVLGYLVMPFSSSTTLRIALYDRFEVGFEFREIWASMKASRPTLLRAWGFSVALGLIVFVPVLALTMAPTLALTTIVSTPGSGEPLVASAAALLIPGVSLLMQAAVGFVGLITGVANDHYWGRHAAAAYGLGTVAPAGPDPQAEIALTPDAEVAPPA
jgi:hypothetical protein